jgi:hypothetical protein
MASNLRVRVDSLDVFPVLVKDVEYHILTGEWTTQAKDHFHAWRLVEGRRDGRLTVVDVRKRSFAANALVEVFDLEGGIPDVIVDAVRLSDWRPWKSQFEVPPGAEFRRRAPPPQLRGAEWDYIHRPYQIAHFGVRFSSSNGYSELQTYDVPFEDLSHNWLYRTPIVPTWRPCRARDIGVLVKAED